MGVFLIGVVTILLGATVMWLGAIYQLSEDPAKADDARLLLGVGVGMLLAGCGFSVVMGVLYPDTTLEAKRAAMAHGSLAAMTLAPKQPTSSISEAATPKIVCPVIPSTVAAMINPIATAKPTN